MPAVRARGRSPCGSAGAREGSAPRRPAPACDDRRGAPGDSASGRYRAALDPVADEDRADDRPVVGGAVDGGGDGEVAEPADVVADHEAARAGPGDRRLEHLHADAERGDGGGAGDLQGCGGVGHRGSRAAADSAGPGATARSRGSGRQAMAAQRRGCRRSARGRPTAASAGRVRVARPAGPRPRFRRCPLGRARLRGVAAAGPRPACPTEQSRQVLNQGAMPVPQS